MPRFATAAACCLGRPAGEESRDDQGEFAAEGDRDTASDCGPLPVPAEVRLGTVAGVRDDEDDCCVFVCSGAVGCEDAGGTEIEESCGPGRDTPSLRAVIMMCDARAERDPAQNGAWQGCWVQKGGEESGLTGLAAAGG